MSEDELWEAYATRNPSFDGDEAVTMGAAGLRKLFRQTWSIAYDSGYRRGLREATERAKSNDSRPTADNEAFNIFKGIFK